MGTMSRYTSPINPPKRSILARRTKPRVLSGQRLNDVLAVIHAVQKNPTAFCRTIRRMAWSLWKAHARAIRKSPEDALWMVSGAVVYNDRPELVQGRLLAASGHI